LAEISILNGANANRLGNSSNEIFAFFAPSSLIWLPNQHERNAIASSSKSRSRTVSRARF